MKTKKAKTVKIKHKCITRNRKKISKLKFKSPLYDFHITFRLDDYQDVDWPHDWLIKNIKIFAPSVKNVEDIFVGSGFGLVTGHRDFHFCGTEHQMREVASAFAESPFYIVDVSTYVVVEQ